MSYTPKQFAQSFSDKSPDSLREMILLEKVLALKSFRQIIFNPKLNLDEKRGILTGILSGNFNQKLIDFSVFLLAENSLKDFSKIFFEFKKILANPPAGGNRIALSGTVTSAKKISEDEKRKIEQDLTQKLGLPIILEVILQPDLLGGVIINVDGKTYDNSFQTKLNRLKN